VSDINISVDRSEITTAQKALETFGDTFAKVVQRVVREEAQVTKALKASATVIEKAVDQQINQLNTGWLTAQKQKVALMENSRKMAERQAAAEAKLSEELERQAIAFQRAKADTAFALGAQRAEEEAAALQRLNAEKTQAAAREEFLKSRYDQSYAAMRIYKTEVQLLNEALESGAIDQRIYAANIDNLNNQLAKGSGAFSQFNLHQNQAASRANQLGVVVQQTGYQVGDFLVQVQSGTNWMVAFGQQATQLVGTLPLLSDSLGISAGRLIAISTGLGIVIPLITALGAVWMRSGEQASGSAKAVDEYTRAIQAAQSEITTLSDKLLEMRFPDLSDAQRLINVQIDELVAKAGELRQKIEDISGAPYVEPLRLQLYEDLEAVEKKLLDIRNKYGDISEGQADLALGAAELARFTERQRQAAQNVLIPLREQNERVQAIKNILDNINGMSLQVKLNIDTIVSGLPSWATSLWDQLGEVGRQGRAETLGSAGRAGSSPPRRPQDIDFGTPEPSSGGGGGGSGGGSDSRVQSLIEELQTERETLEAWYKESNTTLQEATAAELEIIGGKNEAKLRLEQEYQAQLYELKQQESEMVRNAARGMYDDLGSLLSMFAGKSKAAAIASIALNKALRIGEIVQNTAAAQVRAYAELGPIAGSAAAARIGLFGKIQAGIVAATGLAEAANVGGGSGGGGTGGSGPSSVSGPSPVSSGQPQTVYIDSITPDALYSGQTLINLFEAFYKENDNQGRVFVVRGR